MKTYDALRRLGRRLGNASLALVAAATLSILVQAPAMAEENASPLIETPAKAVERTKANAVEFGDGVEDQTPITTDKRRRINVAGEIIFGDGVDSPSINPDAPKGANWIMRAHGPGECWFCGFASGFMDSAKTFAKNGYNVFLSENLTGILEAVLLIWLAVRAYEMTLGVGNPGTILWNIIKKMSLFFVIWAMLKGMGQNLYWEAFYDEPLDMAVRAANALAGGSGAAAGDGGTAGLTSLIRTMESVTFNQVALGWDIMVNFKVVGTALGAGILSFLGGAMLMFMFAMSIIYYTFFILDIVVRISIISALAPLFIAFYLMEQTRGFAIKALMGLVQSFFTLAGSTLVFRVTSQLINSGISLWASGPEVSALAKIHGPPAPGAAGMIAFIDSTSASISPFDAGFWYVFCAGLLSVGLCKKISAMMQTIFQFSDGGGNMADKAVGIAGKAVGAAVVATTALAAAVAAPVAMGAGSIGMVGAKWGAGKAAGVMGSLANTQLGQMATNAAANFAATKAGASVLGAVSQTGGVFRDAAQKASTVADLFRNQAKNVTSWTRTTADGRQETMRKANWAGAPKNDGKGEWKAQPKKGAGGNKTGRQAPSFSDGGAEGGGGGDFEDYASPADIRKEVRAEFAAKEKKTARKKKIKDGVGKAGNMFKDVAIDETMKEPGQE
jgi:hypothetical protein